VSRAEPLVSIGLPVRNGEPTIGRAVRSVLEQGHARLELVISDNASDDGTEEICQELARSDARVRYVRQPQNIGLIPNFYAVLHQARGTYFKWIGHDDWLAPTYVGRCVEVLDDDPALILVTTKQCHVGAGGEVASASYDRDELQSPRPIERFREMLRVLNGGLLDPLYGMIRPDPVAALPRPIMLNEDLVFAGRLALAGRLAHIDEVLSYRGEAPPATRAATARRLGVPAWQACVTNLLMSRELLVAVREAGLAPRERREAMTAILRFFVRSHKNTLVRRTRKLAGIASRGPARFPGSLRRHAGDTEASPCLTQRDAGPARPPSS
jgi:glycosyltransferase involved in cell wall biosynthesis